MIGEFLTSSNLFLPLIGLVTYIIYSLFIKKSRADIELKNVPGPTPLPIVGDSLHFVGPREDTLNKVIAWCNKYGRRFKCRFGSEQFLFFWGAEDLEKLLSSKQHIEKGGDYDLLMPWLGSGLLTSKGEKWTSSRKMLTPAFHFKILDEFIDVINDQSLKMVDILKKEFPKEQVFDVTPFVKRCTLDIICETAMGKQINAQDNRDTPYLNAIHRVGEIFLTRSLSPWLTSDFVWKLTPYGKEEPKLLRILHGFTEQVIRERKSKFRKEKEEKKGNAVSKADEDIGVKRRLAFLDLLIEAQQNPENNLTDEDIRQQTDTFMFGGHDTTAANIGFTLFLFGAYPAIQAKVQEELDAIYGDDRTRPVTTKDFTQMKYLESCLKESLRLYPSAPMITRRLTTDMKLDDGVTVPAGVNIIPVFFQLHRDPKHFPNPEEFNPGRWTQQESARHPYSYLPFSAGPRNCIGQKFAMLEEKVIIANILRNFKLKSAERVEDLKLLNEITLGSKSGIRLSLEPR